MKGLELAERFFESVFPDLMQRYPSASGRIAAGLVGEGSECFGFDDGYSQDHDWGPRFVIWLSEEDFREYGADLARWYDDLPKYFRGYHQTLKTPEAAGREGVMKAGGFYRRYLGREDAPDTAAQWFALPETYLSVVTNGKVFLDFPGEFTRIREKLLAFYPEDVRIKKIAARAAVMAQSGQYNYLRCVRRGETVAAELALCEFIRAGISMIYLLNRRYMPFYKWAHRGLRDLGRLSSLAASFEFLAGNNDSEEKTEKIEYISETVLQELAAQGLCETGDSFLLAHCGEMMKRIQDPGIRGLHVMAG